MEEKDWTQHLLKELNNSNKIIEELRSELVDFNRRYLALYVYDLEYFVPKNSSDDYVNGFLDGVDYMMGVNHAK